MSKDKNLQNQLFFFLQNWGSGLNQQERDALKRKALECGDVYEWTEQRKNQATLAGGGAGVLGGPIAYAAMGIDLIFCQKTATAGCLGVGFIKGLNVDFENDMNEIMALWTGAATISSSVPIGKVGLKLNSKLSVKLGTKMLPKAVGKGTGLIIAKGSGAIVGAGLTKIGAKGTAKVASKIVSKVMQQTVGKVASKGAAKISAKLAAKIGVGWIPIVGGVVNASVNRWIVGSLIDSGVKYYHAMEEDKYLVYSSEIITEEEALSM
ncbi:hypothetical protein C7B61_11925 [filamentous cyanobacterium CCP1]|nr:hypothetical protein C7B76_23465 [filamentous cyanobacterium CCP2]PSB64717.1 hypothetical protein C7B61_11925 [filamentous cyanobacterium CCP1]